MNQRVVTDVAGIRKFCGLRGCRQAAVQKIAFWAGGAGGNMRYKGAGLWGELAPATAYYRCEEHKEDDV